MNLFDWWVVPATVMTAWTVVACVLAFVLPLGAPIQNYVGPNALLVIANPKSPLLTQRPSTHDVAVVLGVGLMPVLNVVALGLQLYLVYLAVRIYLGRRSQARAP